MSTLHEAASMGQMDLLESLLAAHADINGQDGLGWTPLHWAAEADRPNIVKRLINAGANVNVRDTGGSTPLHRRRDGEPGDHRVARGARRGCEPA